jgi:hypothetical protein
MPAEWVLPLQIGAVGALVFATGGLIFPVLFFGSLVAGTRIPITQPATLMLNPHPPGKATILDRISLSKCDSDNYSAKHTCVLGSTNRALW